MQNSESHPSPEVAEQNSAQSEATRQHLLDFDIAGLRKWLIELGEQKYRCEQILQWIYQHGADDFEAMSNLSKKLRTVLAEQAAIYTGQVVRQSNSEDGTHKLLIEWPDGGQVETVWIPDGDRHTVCLSSQVGCPVGCRFCASGIDGMVRDLTAGEIVEQALRVSGLISQKADGARLSNVVMMGMGEPLANYDNVVAAIRTLNASWGLGIGARKITLSTVGLPKQIRRLAEEELQLNLALSLHAPDETLRREIIPWGKVPLDDLLDACQHYFKATGREITLEYVLLAEVNDRPRHALALSKIAKNLRANVNLLRYNPVEGLPYKRPVGEDAFAFQQLLRKHGVNAHLRKSRGRDIDAACGQLRRKTASEQTALHQLTGEADRAPSAPDEPRP
jgi:23S rRNA (adenine2503-C2)-methyltransferase